MMFVAPVPALRSSTSAFAGTPVPAKRKHLQAPARAGQRAAGTPQFLASSSAGPSRQPAPATVSRRAAILALTAAGLAGASPARAAPAPTSTKLPEVGSPAPDFTLSGLDGTVTLSDYKGKSWVVLYFYPADFTSGCTIEARRFQETLQQFHDLNAEVVGVSADTVESHNGFCDEYGLRFPLLSDAEPRGAVSRLYGSWLDFKFGSGSARNTFLIDPEGVVRERFENVRAATHPPQVLARLAALQGKEVPSS
eukprot:tig00021373_g21073.t1